MMIINLIFFENFCFAIYTLYLLLYRDKNLDYNEITNRLSNLYTTSAWSTTIFVRYIYLYILYFVMNQYFPNYIIYSYIIHFPPFYNIYIEPSLHIISTHIYNILEILFKYFIIYLFCITIRLHPDTTRIDPTNLYMNISNIYHSNLYDCIYHCIIILILTFCRNFNYINYKCLKYIYYYQSNYNFTITLQDRSSTHDYFNKIITLGCYKNIINTPLFAYHFIHIFPITINYIIFIIYFYNILNCANILVETYIISDYYINWCINYVIILTILLIIDYHRENWKIHMLRFLCGFIYPSSILIMLLINSDSLLAFKVLYTKYRMTTTPLSKTTLTMNDLNENVWN